MSQIIHNTSFPNDGLGDPLRTAFGNQNTMNTELYTTKVDVVFGKGLTSNDFTNALKAKLDAIASGAEVNVQPDWNQLDDTQDNFIKNKPDTFFSSVGYFHYADTATTTSPIAVVPDLAKKLTNDTLGAYTNITQAPYGVTDIWNPTTNQFDLSDLTIGDSLQFRADILLTTTSANQDVSLYIKFGIGSPSEYKILIDNFNLKTITTDYHVLKSCIFSIDNDDWRDFPAEVYILSDDNATVIVNGWYVPIIRKSVNILDINAIDETANHSKGDYNIVTNTPSLSNATGFLNDEYKNTVAGTRDFGAGDVTVGINDIIAFNGTVWYLKVNNNQTGVEIEPLKTFTSTLSQSFGDSITVGLLASAGNEYINLLSNLYGVSNTQRAISATGVFQSVKAHNQYINPNHNNFCTVMSGFNDVRRGGNEAKTLAKISNAYRGIICNHFLNRYIGINTVSSSIVKSGTWTVYDSPLVGGKALGSYSLVSGNYMEYTFKDTNVVLAMIGGDGVTDIHGTFTVHIDGILQGSYSSNNQTDGINDSLNSNTRSPYVLFFKNLTNTQHVIKVTHTNTNALAIDYVGHLSQAKFVSPLLIMDAPYMDATGYAISPANATTPIIYELNALIDTVIAEFGTEYPIYKGKTNDFYNITTGLGTDHIHPNNVGHRQIYEAGMDALKKLTVNKSAGDIILGLANNFTGINTFSEQTKMSKGLEIKGSFSPAPVGEGMEYEYYLNQGYISALNRTGTIWKPLNFRGNLLNFLINNVIRFVIKSNTFNSTVPTYADDSVAGTGGLVSGDFYKTATGEVRIKL